MDHNSNLGHGNVTRRTCLKAFAGAFAVPLAAGLAGCGSTSGPSSAGSDTGSSASGASYKIGALQLTEHQALDDANQGFVDALDDSGISYTIDQQNAQNDQTACQTIASKLVNDGNDLILAIATPAAQAVAGATSDIPIVATAITDFQESGLVQDNDKPGTNVTGTSDLTPIKEQMELLQQLFPDAKTVGILYCSAESNSDIQASMAEDAAKGLGLSTERYTVSSSNEIQQVVESMVGNVDVCYAPTDNTIAAGMSTVTMVANDNGLPVIAGEENMVANGALASYSINYHDLGYKAGQMAVKILQDGDDPADMAIEYLDADECTLVVNSDTASALGVDISGLDGATDLAGTAE